MRKVGDGEEPYEYFQEHGTSEQSLLSDVPKTQFNTAPRPVVVWRWLGFDRFFPPDKPFQKVVRGVASVRPPSQSHICLHNVANHYCSQDYRGSGEYT